MDKELKKELDSISDEEKKIIEERDLLEEEDLALTFAAKKENEELREELKITHSKNKDLQKKVNNFEWFLSNMNRFPYFWARTYKKYIKIFMDNNGIQ